VWRKGKKTDQEVAKLLGHCNLRKPSRGVKGLILWKSLIEKNINELSRAEGVRQKRGDCARDPGERCVEKRRETPSSWRKLTSNFPQMGTLWFATVHGEHRRIGKDRCTNFLNPSGGG